MNDDDVVDVQAKDKSQAAPDPTGTPGDSEESVKTWGWISYILHLIVAVAVVVPSAQPSITLLIVAQVIDLVKRGQAAGTWQASHFSWRIRTVWWAFLFYLITFPLWLLIWPGWLAWTLISIWFLYRIIKGMERMNAGQPVGPAS